MKKKTFRTAILALLLLALTVFAGYCAYANDTDVSEEAEETPVEQIDVYSSITSSEDSLDADLVYRADFVEVSAETATMSETIRINSDFSFRSGEIPSVFVDGKKLSLTETDTNVYSTESGSCTMQLIDPRPESETPGYVIVNINKPLKSGQNLLVVVPVTLTDVPTEAGSYSYDIGGAATSSLVTYSTSGGTLAGYNFDPLTYNLTIQEVAAAGSSDTASSSGSSSDSTAAAAQATDSSASNSDATDSSASNSDATDSTDAVDTTTDDVAVETDTTESASGSTSTQQSSQSAVMQNLAANGGSNNLYAIGLSALVMAVAVALIFVLRHRMTVNEKKNRRAH